MVSKGRVSKRRLASSTPQGSDSAVTLILFFEKGRKILDQAHSFLAFIFEFTPLTLVGHLAIPAILPLRDSKKKSITLWGGISHSNAGSQNEFLPTQPPSDLTGQGMDRRPGRSTRVKVGTSGFAIRLSLPNPEGGGQGAWADRH